MQDILLVSFGAILGVNIRFLIVRSFDKYNLSKYNPILIINTFASFLLGLFLSIVSKIGADMFSYQLVLFFSIGCLGSLSTFSTFVYDLFDACLKLNFSRVLKIFILSLLLGTLALAFGLFLGNR